MKDSMDSTAVGRALDPEAFANRKLIRPGFQPQSIIRATTATAASATQRACPNAP